MASKRAPYGTWVSPISAESIAKGANTISDVIVDPVTSTVYHIEDRALEKGRAVLVQTHTKKDIVDQAWNVRTAVHEYGGSAAVVYNGIAYFSHLIDGKVYEVDVNGGEPVPVTPDKPYRYANFSVVPTHPHLLVSILEDHTVDVPSEIINQLCIIDTKKHTVHTLISGADFYAKPTFSSDGTKIAWQQWYHPDMPWNGSEIHVASVLVESANGSPTLSITNDVLIAGVRSKTSAAYPTWVDNNVLMFTSDESGYINPWTYNVAENQATPFFSTPVLYEFGRPGWFLHWFPYAVLGGTHAAFNVLQDGRDVLCLVPLSDSSKLQFIDSPYVKVEVIRAVGSDVVFMGKTVDEGLRVIRCSFSLLGSPVAKFHFVDDTTTETPFPKSIISLPKTITIQTPTLTGISPIYLIYYPPHNPSYAGTSVDGEKPPCVVNIHGGPTSFFDQGLAWEIQYYTSRGWAWLNVNYGGSSGYGKAFIDRLSGFWGVVDGQDVVYAARSISSEQYNLVDPKRMVIRGGSAGGFTTLSVLTSGHGLHDALFSMPFSFAAGTSIYGVSDLQKLTASTHKFQSRYVDKLMGGTYEEIPEVYKARSPVHNSDNVTTPLLLLQGDKDKIVLKEQSELIFTSIKRRGGVVEYNEYEGEGHGWRKEETIRDALEREREFYERILGLQ